MFRSNLVHLEPEAGGEVGEDRVSGVAGLLARDAQVLLQRPRDLGQHRLGRVVGVQRGGGGGGGCRERNSNTLHIV